MVNLLELVSNEKEELVCGIFIKLPGESYQYTDGIPLVYDEKNFCLIFADAPYVLATLVDQYTFEEVQDCIYYMINEGKESCYSWEDNDEINFKYEIRRQSESQNY